MTINPSLLVFLQGQVSWGTCFEKACLQDVGKPRSPQRAVCLGLWCSPAPLFHSTAPPTPPSPGGLRLWGPNPSRGFSRHLKRCVHFNPKTRKTKQINVDTKEASVAGFQAPLFMADISGPGSLPLKSFSSSRKTTPTYIPTASSRVFAKCQVQGLRAGLLCQVDLGATYWATREVSAARWLAVLNPRSSEETNFFVLPMSSINRTEDFIIVHICNTNTTGDRGNLKKLPPCSPIQGFLLRSTAPFLNFSHFL